jgi:diaminopimelate decarboxylase
VKAWPLPERPPGLTYRRKAGVLRLASRELFAEEISVSKLAEKYGTPLYVYSAAAIRERYQELDHAFRGQEHTVCYSVKANSNLSVLKLLAKMGAGFDVVSGGELQRVIAADRESKSKVVFSGVGKQADEIDLALHSGILLFNVESASELKLLGARAAHLGKHAQFAVRVNPDVNAETHPYISTGMHEHKFGVPVRDALELYRVDRRYLDPAGVSVHIGSQIRELSPFHESMEKIAEFTNALRAEGHKIRYIDAGGGLGINYRSQGTGDFADETKRYATEITAPIKKLNIHLLLEPGRAIVGPSGILVTRIVYRKRNNGKLFLITDAAMNDLIRPALYAAFHEIVSVRQSSKRPKVIDADVVGPICESSDFFARNRKLANVDEGELLAILDVGAYGMSLASNYNTRPRAAEVLVDGGRARIIRRRETMDDLLRPEKALSRYR